jgi:hypothetical protein
MFRKILHLGLLTALAILAMAGHANFNGHADAQSRGPGWRHHDYWQPGWMRRHRWGHHDDDTEMRARMQRHWTFMHEGLPPDYENARSTVYGLACGVD